jgi:hypothetical protein
MAWGHGSVQRAIPTSCRLGTTVSCLSAFGRKWDNSLFMILRIVLHYLLTLPQVYLFFLIGIVGGWSPTGSTRHVGHQLAYCTCPGWLRWWRNWWNENWQGKPRYSEKTCPSANLSTTNPTWPDRARTRAAAVGSQRLTAWAMERPTGFTLLASVRFQNVFCSKSRLNLVESLTSNPVTRKFVLMDIVHCSTELTVRLCTRWNWSQQTLLCSFKEPRPTERSIWEGK